MSGRARATLEDETRAAIWRRVGEEENRKAEARRRSELATEARLALQIQDRVSRAIDRPQQLVSRIENHLRAELHEATRTGDNGRRVLIEAEIDALFRDLAKRFARRLGDER